MQFEFITQKKTYKNNHHPLFRSSNKNCIVDNGKELGSEDPGA